MGWWSETVHGLAGPTMGTFLNSGVSGSTGVAQGGGREWPEGSSSINRNSNSTSEMFYNSMSNGTQTHSGTFRPHKRHLQEPLDAQHHAKRRLVDHLGNLSIGQGGGGFGFSADQNSANGARPSVFGSFTQEQLKRPLSDPNRVIIRNIDQFLRENPDQLDLIGEKVQLDDLRKAGLDKLVVSCGLDIKKAWSKIVSRYRSKQPVGEHNTDVDELVYKLIWEEYLAKYFSLIKYYDPLKMVWQKYTTWLQKKRNPTLKSPYITELDSDGDDIMVDEDDEGPAVATDANVDVDELSEREQSLRDGTSGYGSYYTRDDHWHDLALPGYHQMDAMIEDVDDGDGGSGNSGSVATANDNDNDVMMEDD